jgi:hypothetical protein
MDEVIVKFNGKMVSHLNIPYKQKRFGIILYKLCDSRGNTYDMSIYLREECVDAVADVSITNERAHKVISVGCQIQGVHLFLDLHNGK